MNFDATHNLALFYPSLLNIAVFENSPVIPFSVSRHRRGAGGYPGDRQTPSGPRGSREGPPEGPPTGTPQWGTRAWYRCRPTFLHGVRRPIHSLLPHGYHHPLHWKYRCCRRFSFHSERMRRTVGNAGLLPRSVMAAYGLVRM